MRTVEDCMPLELLLTKDYLDALETSLVTVSDKTSAHHNASQQLQSWWERVEEIECRDIRYATEGKDTLKDIIALAETAIIEQRKWPATPDLFDSALYLEDIQDCEALLKDALKAYDAKRYLAKVAIPDAKMTPAEQADARFAAFNKSSADIGEGATQQEALALYRWELNTLSNGVTSLPGPRDVFDPAHVEVKRLWRSATQLETGLYYDGEFLGNVGDDAILHPLGFYHPKMNEFDAYQAVRKMFYHGNPGIGLAPLNRTTPTGQRLRLLVDIPIAQDQCDKAPESMQRIGCICEEIEHTDAPLALASEPPAPSGQAPLSP